MKTSRKLDIFLRFFSFLLLLIAVCFDFSRPIRFILGLLAVGIICAGGVLQYAGKWHENPSAGNKWSLILFSGFAVVVLALVVGAYFWLA